MSDDKDLVDKLLGYSEIDVCADAADEIVGLRSACARLRADREKLRAELAAEKKRADEPSSILGSVARDVQHLANLIEEDVPQGFARTIEQLRRMSSFMEKYATNPTSAVVELTDKLASAEAELAAERERANDMEVRLDRAVAIFNAEVAKNATLRAALEPFAEKHLYPDDIGEEFARDVRHEEDWDEAANDAAVDDCWIKRGWVRRARAVLKETKGGDSEP
jgi:hypothetical protein